MKYFLFFITFIFFPNIIYSEQNVLVIHSYHLGYKWTDDIQKGIMETFSKEDMNIDFHIEYMDTKRLNNSEYIEKLTDLLMVKYSDISIDVIISSDDNAYNFLIDNRNNFFPLIPIIFCGINYFEETEIEDFPLLKVVTEEANIKRNMDLIFTTHRNTKELVFITDITTTGKKVRNEFEKQILLFDKNIKFTILDNISFDNLQSKIKQLENDSVVLYAFFFRDSNDAFIEYDESALKVTEASNVPVYGLWDFSLGYGIMGGLLTSGFLQGGNAALLAIKYLKGDNIDEIQNILKSPNSYLYDYEELIKFNIKLNKLPKGSVIINKPYSLLDFYLENKFVVLTFLLIVIIIILSLLIFSYLQMIKFNKRISLSEKQYKAIFENTGNATIIIENNNIISLANTQFCKLVGLTKDLIEGKKSWIDFATKDDTMWMGKYHSDRRKIINDTSGSYESHMIGIDNQIKNILVKIDLIPGTNRSVASIIDITERKRTEEQLSQIHKMEAIGQLAGGIAHDFNNSLAGIIGATELVLSGDCNNEQRTFLDMIITSAERAGELTKKLLLFSRKGQKLSSPVNMKKIIDETVKLVQHTIDKNISISIIDNSTNAMILGDDSMLQNAAMNLANNSSHAIAHRGNIVFTLENIILDSEYCGYSPFDLVPGEYLKIDISDTGTGMTPEIKSHIFEPFFTTKDQGKGTGIGLTTVYSTIKDHNGAINVHSEDGHGTTFNLLFPITSDKFKNENSKSLIKGSGSILIIDDEELIRVTSKAMLVSLGYNVFCAENGKIGVEFFTKNYKDIDLVILDMIMPVMGGREAFGHLREIDKKIPIIISSGYAKDHDIEELNKKGISKYIHKPFRLIKLSEVVSEILS